MNIAVLQVRRVRGTSFIGMARADAIDERCHSFVTVGVSIFPSVVARA